MILILIFAEVLGQTKTLTSMIVYWLADKDQQVFTVLSLPCSWTQRPLKAVAAKLGFAPDELNAAHEKTCPPWKPPPPHYFVIICIEYLLAIGEWSRRLLLLGALQKRKHAIGLCLMGELLYWRRKYYSDRVPISWGCLSEDLNFIFLWLLLFLLPQLYSPVFFFITRTRKQRL